MKRVFSGLLLMVLCVGLLTCAFRIQPARGIIGTYTPIAPLSVSVTPLYAVLSGGQTQLFNATVTGGSPPYTYQWYIDADPVSGATNPTFNYTAPPYQPYPTYPDINNVWISVTDNAGTNAQGWAQEWEPAYGSPVYCSVEPVPVAPLTNVNASINGLETPPTPSPVGENFTVEIHLRSATAINAPDGVGGVEVHFYFGNILDYCKPLGFVDELGQPDGALVGPLVYVYEGFYDDNLNPIANPPYTNATQYIVAAGSETGPWNGNDGLVAKIAFQITGQPVQNMSQPDFYAQLQIGMADLINWNGYEVPFSVVQGILHIDAIPVVVGDLNGDGKVSLQDLQLLALAYGSKVGDSNWNPMADLAPPYGIISLTDLVTLGMHYGQHFP